MKKKLMMIAFLSGALILGSCVKDSETQSVEEVRNAKAEQLLARAELNKAKAEAAKVAADAEVALMAAKAKAEQANAAKAKAEAEKVKVQNALIELQMEAQRITNEAQKIENQKKQLELQDQLRQLEIAKAQAEKDLADVAAEMAAQEINMKAALAKRKAELADAQQALIDYEQTKLANADAAEKAAMEERVEALKNLSSTYALAVKDLYDAQVALTTVENELTALEEDLVDWKTQKEESIASYKESIDRAKQQIAVYKEYANYKTDEQIAELQAKRDEINNSKMPVVLDAYYATVDAYNKANVSDFAELNEKRDELVNNPFYRLIQNGVVYEVKNEDGDVIETYDLYRIRDLRNDYGWNLSSFNFLSYRIAYSNQFYFEFGANEVDIEKGENKTSYYYADNYYVDSLYTRLNINTTADARIIEMRINETVEVIVAQKEDAKEFLDKLKANYNGTATGYYETFDVYNESVYGKDDKKLNAVDSAASAKAIYDKDITDVVAKANYERAIEVEKWLKDQIAMYEESYKGYDNHIAAFNAYLDFWKNRDKYIEELKAATAEYNAFVEKTYAAQVAAYTEYAYAYWAYEDLNAELEAILFVLECFNGGYGEAYGAEWIQSRIQANEESIVRYEELIADYSEADSKEKTIELKKLEVEVAKVNLDAAKAAEAAAKADLDELLDSEE